MGSSNNGPTWVSSIPNVQPPTFIVKSCVGGQCSCVASNASIGPFSETKAGPVANSSQNADIHASLVLCPAWHDGWYPPDCFGETAVRCQGGRYGEALSCDVDGRRTAISSEDGVDRQGCCEKACAISDSSVGRSIRTWLRQVGSGDL